MSPIQIIILVIIALIIIKTFQKYRQQAITIREFFLWISFWLIAAVLFIFPNLTQTVAKWLGVGRGVDLIIYLGLIVLFFAVFYILLRIERLERDITKVVREEALKNSKS